MSDKTTDQLRRGLQNGDAVQIIGDHPWQGCHGEIVAFEKYGLGWMGFRVALDSGPECYASASNLRRIR